MWRAGGRWGPQIGITRRSDRANVPRFFALAAGSDLELDLLALFEHCVISAPGDVRAVNEDVLTLFSGDEAKALLGAEPLDGSSCQLLMPFVWLSLRRMPRRFSTGSWEAPSWSPSDGTLAVGRWPAARVNAESHTPRCERGSCDGFAPLLNEVTRFLDPQRLRASPDGSTNPIHDVGSQHRIPHPDRHEGPAAELLGPPTPGASRRADTTNRAGLRSGTRRCGALPCAAPRSGP